MSPLHDTLDIYQRIQRKTLDKNILFRVDWDITCRCNLKCIHCYQAETPSRKELTKEEAFSVLDELASLNCLTITFTGGEIFLREDFFDIARFARKKEFALYLFSNGTLIDEDAADKIRQICPVAVEISLYGMSPEVHEKVTGVPGSFQKTINAFRLLNQRNIKTVVKSTVMKANLSEFDKIKEFADQTQSRFLFSASMIPKIDGSKEVLKNRLSQDELKEFFGSNLWIAKGVAKGGVKVYKPLCSAGVNSLFISAYGDVFPCVALRQYCGNVRENTLKEIWQSQVIRKIRNISFEDLGRCKKCEFADYCDRCGGSALLETGDLLGCSGNDRALAGVRKWVVEKMEVQDEKRQEEILSEAKSSI